MNSVAKAGCKATGTSTLEGRGPATYHVGCHLPVFAELFRLHQLLRHSLPSLTNEQGPKESGGHPVLLVSAASLQANALSWL